MGSRRKSLAAGAVLLGLCAAGVAEAQDNPLEALAAGKPILEIRGRYEFVDQDRLPEDADAYTVRVRAGWQTGSWRNLSGLAELDAVQHVGPERFAVNVPGANTPPLNGADKARFPVVNDPDVLELNRLQLAWTPSKGDALTLGRQRILIGDQRFVGAVPWRQDEQTFDAARVDLSTGQVRVLYAYVSRVNRLIGDLRDWDSDSHLLNAVWAPTPALNLEGFVYALDFETSPINSSLTEGVKATGGRKAGPWRFGYAATYARQSDWRGRTADFSLDYVGLEFSAAHGPFGGAIAWDSLEGNGARGFSAPLGSAHAFNGWSDAFVQPGGAKGFVDGLEDLNLTFTAKPALKYGPLSSPDFLLRHHWFKDERTGADLGQEWGAQLQFKLGRKWAALLKYADFRREGAVPAGTATPPASRTKVWMSLEYKL
ncbi:alginate export family protein [Phenylobacterium deserti]|uniref:Alginate export domain-containing protein n=1 Tax=Phenylobacterium deserti TaxID=1914756 RepID=A0A328AAB3_9CAUL|nr:alginate export family protein [Phenylobacterium deserti]RAK51357.1 hypothetical protein DJ018_15555 [Phenylobacterium deserti]